MTQGVSPRNSFSFSWHPRIGGTEGTYSRGYWPRHVTAMREVAGVIEKHCWVASIFEGGHKKNDLFEYSDFAAFDFDDPRFSLEEAKKYFAHYMHVIGTTKSHQQPKSGQPPCDRFRVIVPWTQRVLDCATYAFNTRRIGEPLYADPKGYRASQYMKPCREIISILERGYGIVPLQPPLEPVRAYTNVHAGRRYIPQYIKHLLVSGFTSGERHAKLYHVACVLGENGFTLDETIEMIMTSPLKEQGDDGDSRRTAGDGWRKGKASQDGNHRKHSDSDDGERV